MQTEKNPGESFPAASDSKNEGLVNDSHYVFITDDSGIDRAFEHIKSKLRMASGNCLTLIYSIRGEHSHPLFKAELESIEKRFPAQLLSYYIFNKDRVSGGNSELNQQILEVVINSNVRKFMQFRLLGEAEMLESISDRLRFLGIHPTQIYSQIIK